MEYIFLIISTTFGLLFGLFICAQIGLEVNDMDFERCIVDALEEMSERNERVMKNFFYRIGHKGIVGYENDLGKKVFTIWTDKPGILIGKDGQNVEILKEILKEEFDYDYEIKFKEIKAKMLVIM